MKTHLMLIVLLMGIIVGMGIKYITEEKCDVVVEETRGGGFFVETSGWRCEVLKKNCERFIEKGYACEIGKDSSDDFICSCEVSERNY